MSLPSLFLSLSLHHFFYLSISLFLPFLYPSPLPSIYSFVSLLLDSFLFPAVIFSISLPKPLYQSLTFSVSCPFSLYSCSFLSPSLSTFSISPYFSLSLTLYLSFPLSVCLSYNHSFTLSLSVFVSLTPFLLPTSCPPLYLSHHLSLNFLSFCFTFFHSLQLCISLSMSIFPFILVSYSLSLSNSLSYLVTEALSLPLPSSSVIFSLSLFFHALPVFPFISLSLPPSLFTFYIHVLLSFTLSICVYPRQCPSFLSSLNHYLTVCLSFPVFLSSLSLSLSQPLPLPLSLSLSYRLCLSLFPYLSLYLYLSILSRERER